MVRLLFSPDLRWFAVVAVWLVGALFTLAWWRFPCPHCGAPMLRAWGGRAADLKRCRHCRIAVGTPQSLAGPSRVAPMLRVADHAPGDLEQDEEVRAEDRSLI
jgi:hypothetical protein